jgi:C_GCAxxG_C_C family probable redox protein
MNKTEQALNDFKSGFNCAQAVLAAFGPELGLDREQCRRIAAGFGSGLGDQKGLCGAVNAGIMVIGLKAGANGASGKPYKLVGQFLKEFSDRFQGSVCRDVLRNTAKMPKYPGQTRSCAHAVAAVIEILEKTQPA